MADGQPVADRFIGDLTGDTVDAAHAIFSAGVMVDEDLHPLDATGAVALHNVFCAGSVIGGYNPARDQTALGVAIWTGQLAGELAARETL